MPAATGKERGGKLNTAGERGRVHSSDRRRAAGLVTLMPNAFALCRQSVSVDSFPWWRGGRQSDRAFEVMQYKREYAPRQDGDPVPTRDTMCDLSRELFVVHKQEIDLPEVVDDEFFETVW